ncbi:unnamed protein product [Heterobilharzia americana]|nr:unnamed protein product [Heterobilharzia americana]
MPKCSDGNSQNRKNRPLKRSSPRWRSTFPISVSQLQKKRDEFWDTAPAFEGRIEIWNALKVVADFCQKQDYDMAQAILDGACITLPSGTLCDCYDELGARYQLPLYVLSQPSNLLPDHSTSDTQSVHSQQQNNASPIVLRNSNTIHYTNDGGAESNSSGISRTHSHHQYVYNSNNNNNTNTNNDDNHTSSNDICGCLSLFNTICHRNRRNINRHTTNWFQWNFNPYRCEGNPSLSDKKESINPNSLSLFSSSSSSPISHLNLRLSTGEQHKLKIIDEKMTILQAKCLYASICGWHELRQRWYVYGRLLSNKLQVKECYIPKDFIIQVIVHSPYDPECSWKQEKNKPTTRTITTTTSSSSSSCCASEIVITSI